MKLAAFAAPPSFILGALFLALCVLAPAPASAQSGRDSIFVVSGVRVDETAANGAAAQQAGFAAAYRSGFERLVRRLAVPGDLAARGMPALDAAGIERLVQSVDVEEERRSSTRYIGRLALRFDPAGVRALLRQASIGIIEARSSPTLVVPVVAGGVTPETAALWRQVWAQGGYAGELAPIAVAPEALQGAPNWTAAAPFAQSAAAGTALYATLRVQGSTATATLAEVSASGTQNRGEVSAAIGDVGGIQAALASLADQANNRVQSEWKARAPASGGGARARISVSALYSDQAQWERIKDALEGAAQTIVSEIRIEAVGRDGALVSFSFTGDQTQLAAELRRRGVLLENGAQGQTLRIAR